MRIVSDITRMQAEAEAARNGSKTLGLVPTMGSFHEGHLSLMRRARRECEVVVVSLFVNPAQFGPGEDLARYPRDFDRDSDLARSEGVDVLFAPDAVAMYGADYSSFVEVGGASETLCGAARPGHFRGVATVVAKLFNICKPHRAYFGLKDYQQTRVIESMILDLNFGVELVRCPIVREADGLAMSSRNAYLSPEERRAATVLQRSLACAKELVESGECDVGKVAGQLRRMIEAEPLAGIDYAEVAGPETLRPLAEIRGAALLAVAARFGKTRLIDNAVAGAGVATPGRRPAALR